MANEENKGMAFRNLNKLNPNQPDYKMTITINGVTKEISFWIKEGESTKGPWEGLSYLIADPYVKQGSQQQNNASNNSKKENQEHAENKGKQTKKESAKKSSSKKKDDDIGPEDDLPF